MQALSIPTTADRTASLQARPIFPFTAIAGQEDMKLALLLNAIDPKVGGVAIMGDRGTGKTTAVRALADLLPEIDVVDGDPFNSHPTDPDLQSPDVRQRLEQGETLPVAKKRVPTVDLPLGATEDRVCGTLDLERALSEGIKAFEPGLLAQANRGILYIDEVNLLDDHLVDVLLDAAASGWNVVEREGISIRHPARFTLVGSGNPEEGELRPQLLDRFGMHVAIHTEKNPILRVEIVDRRAAFEANPQRFVQKYRTQQRALQKQIVRAQKKLRTVKISRELRVAISQVCANLNIDGLRGDIVTNRAAKALAALEGKNSVAPSHIQRTIALCLRHRLRKDPLLDVDSGEKVMKMFHQVFGAGSS